MYRLLDEVEAQELLANRFLLPCAQLRFVPKASEMRPIVNLSTQGHDGSDSTNRLLRPTYEALRWELLQGGGKTHLLGVSVFNLNDAYHKLLPFIVWWRANPAPLYFVSVDVKQSFDSVNQSKLCEVLFDDRERVFSHERYVLHVPAMGSVTTEWRNIVTPAAQT